MVVTEVHVWKVLYQRMGVLGLVSRLTAQLPVRASLSGDTLLLQFSWWSLPTLYNILWTVCPLFVDRYIIISTKGAFTTSHLIYQALTISVSCAMSVTGWVHVCSLLAQLDSYDSRISIVPVLIKRRTRLEKTFVWVIAPVVYVLYSLLELYNEGISCNIITVLIRSTIHTSGLLQCILYFFFCNEIFCRILQVQTSWFNYAKMVCQLNMDKSRLRLDHYRSLYVDLLACVNHLSAAFGVKLATLCSVMGVNVLVTAYFDFTLCNCFLFWNRDMYLCFVLVISIGYFSRRLHTVSQVMMCRIFNIKIVSMNECLRAQMDLLVYQLARSAVQVAVPGVVHLSGYFTGSFVCALLIYFILVTQLAAEIKGSN